MGRRRVPSGSLESSRQSSRTQPSLRSHNGGRRRAQRSGILLAGLPLRVFCKRREAGRQSSARHAAAGVRRRSGGSNPSQGVSRGSTLQAHHLGREQCRSLLDTPRFHTSSENGVEVLSFRSHRRLLANPLALQPNLDGLPTTPQTENRLESQSQRHTPGLSTLRHQHVLGKESKPLRQSKKNYLFFRQRRCGARSSRATVVKQRAPNLRSDVLGCRLLRRRMSASTISRGMRLSLRSLSSGEEAVASKCSRVAGDLRFFRRPLCGDLLILDNGSAISSPQLAVVRWTVRCGLRFVKTTGYFRRQARPVVA